jgi:hypothetical protein
MKLDIALRQLTFEAFKQEMQLQPDMPEGGKQSPASHPRLSHGHGS